MSTTRDRKNGFNRRRATNLIQARHERKLNQRRRNRLVEQEIFDSMEHDRRVEEELIHGPEPEVDYRDPYRF